MATSHQHIEAQQAPSLRRAVTLPTRLAAASARLASQGHEAEGQTTETLFAHPNARIVYFTTAKSAGPSLFRRDLTQSKIDREEVEEEGTLPWQTQTEHTVALGSITIYRVLGSAAFLDAGASFVKPILAKSQCWCVDGRTKFVLKRGYHDYYRIELPDEGEQDKQIADEFRAALSAVLQYEKTPCPFQRGFHVELPESPQVTFVPWKPKHRPISPVRRRSINFRPNRSPIVFVSHELSDLSTDLASTSQGMVALSATEHESPSVADPQSGVNQKVIRQVSIRPTIGKFETLGKDHEPPILLSRGRPGSSNANAGRTLPLQHFPPVASIASVAEHAAATANKLQHTSKTQVLPRTLPGIRTATAPPDLYIVKSTHIEAEGSIESFTESAANPVSDSVDNELLGLVPNEPAMSITSESIDLYDVYNDPTSLLPSTPPLIPGHITPPSTIGSYVDYGLGVPKNYNHVRRSADGHREESPIVEAAQLRHEQKRIEPPLDDCLNYFDAMRHENADIGIEKFRTTPNVTDQDEPVQDEPLTPICHTYIDTPMPPTSSAKSCYSTFTNQSFQTAGTSTSTSSNCRTSPVTSPTDPPSLHPVELRSNVSDPHQQQQTCSYSSTPAPIPVHLHSPKHDPYEHIGTIIGKKMAGVLLGPPLQLAALMLRIAVRFTDGVRIRDEQGESWSRRAERGRRLPGTWETYGDKGGELGSE